MKRFLLAATLLLFALGTLIADENYTVVTGTSTNSNVPFNLTSTATQTVQLLYTTTEMSSCSLVSGTDKDFEYFTGIQFTANGNLGNLAGNCTIKIMKLGSSTSFPSSLSSETTFLNRTLTVNGTTVSIPFGQNYYYKKSDGNLLVQLEITLSTALSSNITSWLSSNTTVGKSKVGSSETSVLPNTTLIGSRTAIVSYSGNKYKVHTGTNNFVASLEKFNTATSDQCFISGIACGVTNPQTSDVKGGYFTRYKIDATGLKYTINGASQDISLTSIGDTAFKDYAITSHTVFSFPSTITSVGDTSVQNKCFAFNQDTFKVMLIFNSSSAINFYSKNNDFSNLINSSKKSNVLLRVGPIYESVEHPFTSWTNEAVQQFCDLGKTWYPFDVSATNIIGQYISIGKKQYVKVSEYPFGSSLQLKIELTDTAEGAHDGTWCYYNKIDKAYYLDNDNNKVYYNLDCNNKCFTCTLNNENLKIYADLKYYNTLEYGKGVPNFDYTKDAKTENIYMSGAVPYLVYNSDSVIFRSSVYDSVPYWRYTDSGNSILAPETLDVNCPIKVEKEITNKHYRYFSLPFNCNVSDIVVTNGSGTLDLLTTDVESITTLDKDYYIIEEYRGQVDAEGKEGKASYYQIKRTDTTLTANKGYAFAIVESDTHLNQTVTATITFKSGTGEKMHLNTCDTMTVRGLSRTTSHITLARNKNWYMIGNPFYHYLKGNSFYAINDNCSTAVKYVTTINDNDQETVTHHWVESSEGSISGSTDASLINITPFQAFFVQLPDGYSKVVTKPVDANYVYPTTTSNSPALLPAENNIQEHLSVRIAGSDTLWDRTTVIDDTSRDTHFSLGNDLAKIMNPGAQIYAWYDSVPCAFKEIPLRTDSTIIIPLGLRIVQDGTYTIALDTSLTYFDGTAQLHDRLQSRYYPLDEDGVSFELLAGTIEDRFEIVAAHAEIPASTPEIESFDNMNAFVYDGRLTVCNAEQGSVISVFDAVGHLLCRSEVNGDFLYDFPLRGVYFITLQGKKSSSIKVLY